MTGRRRSSSRTVIHYAGAAWAVLFGAPHLWWALGVPAGFPGGPASHEMLITTWRLYFDIGVVGLSVLAVFVALAPIHAWGDTIPRRLLRRLSFAAAFVLTLRGVAGLIADGASDPVWWPTFLTGGILFGAIGFMTARQTANSRTTVT